MSSSNQQQQPPGAVGGDGPKAASSPPIEAPPGPKLHLLVCTVCEHPICDASDILGEKMSVNPEYGFAYKFEGMLNVCDDSSDDNGDEPVETAGSAAVQKAPFCYRIQHKSLATLKRCHRGTDREAERASNMSVVSLGEGLVAQIDNGKRATASEVNLDELLFPNSMTEVCSDQRVDVVRLRERVSDFGVRHEVFATQTEYQLASMDLPDTATLNDGAVVPSFIHGGPPVEPSSPVDPLNPPSPNTSADAGMYFSLNYENVLSSTVEWFPGYVVHNETYCSSCGSPVGYRFVPKPLVPRTDKDTVFQSPDEQGRESFVGVLLSSVKQREWDVRQFSRRTVLAKVHTLFDALSMSRENQESWKMMDCMAELALNQLEARNNGVGPSRANFIETVPFTLRTIMGRLASSLPVEANVRDSATSNRHAQFLSQSEMGGGGAEQQQRDGGGGGGGEGDATATSAPVGPPPTPAAIPRDTASAAALNIRYQQRLRSQVVADSMHHLTRIARQPILFTEMIANFIAGGGVAAREAANAATDSTEDALIATILRDTRQQGETIDRLNTHRHISSRVDESSPSLLATAAQLMESSRRQMVESAVKDRVAGYKQQAKLIQQLVDKLKEQNTVLVDLVASQRTKMRANESQMKMFENIIEAHKSQLTTYDKHIRYQDDLSKTLREQLSCSTSEIEEQQKIMRSQNETIKTQNEQMSILKRMCADLTKDDGVAYRRPYEPPRNSAGKVIREVVTPESTPFRNFRGEPISHKEQERRDENVARALERQEKLAYLKSLLKQKEVLSASLSCNSARSLGAVTSPTTSTSPAASSTTTVPATGVSDGTSVVPDSTEVPAATSTSVESQPVPDQPKSGSENPSVE